ncbi:MAG: cytochrome b/b6 domain-containing protein [Deltaproteobacteria bacterium]|nr:cytochrome b/b6 domain-containing protein [Deltaproteobacteria bacterium]
MSELIQRFNRRQRLQHAAGMVVFTLLVLTGMPQRFADDGWARMATALMGGINTMRLVHRVCGIVFTCLVCFHFGGAIVALLRRRIDLSIVPTRKDFTDAVIALKHQLGMSGKKPRYDRFEYKQKFEYWGLVLGGVVMISTGFVLLFPSWTTWLLPGQFVPMSKVAHANEGMMAFLVIVFWHIYNAHLAPEVFPFDRSMFDGLISRERMEQEHPLELARLEEQAGRAMGEEPKGPPAGGSDDR